MAEIKFRGVEKTYGQFTAVDKLDLVVNDGEFLTLLGPSGCGKSTTLRLIAGFVEPTAGQIFIADEDVTGLPPQRRSIGMVFQDYALFPHLTIADNIGFGLRERGVAKKERSARVAELLALVRLEEFGTRYPAQLSGGQQQRVALARALAFPPRVLLMDEPLGALDLKLRETMQEEIKRIQQELRVTTVYVTHDQAEAIYLSDRIAVMNGGRIEQIGNPQEIYRSPVSRFTADFIGKINFLDALVIATEPDGATVEIANQSIRAASEPGLSRGDRVTVAIRPENLAIHAQSQTDSGRNILPARLVSRSFSGNLVHVRLALINGAEVIVEVRPTQPLPPDGTDVEIDWAPADTIILKS
jgi:spermidine/putrescine ABC transporter ATP-binding subunit